MRRLLLLFAVLVAATVLWSGCAGSSDEASTETTPQAPEVVITKQTHWAVAELPGEAIATNDVGQVFGRTRSWGSYLWQDGKAERFDNSGIDLPGDAAINDRGQVSMECGIVTVRSAFLWEDGTMTDLGTLGGDTSQACDINDEGQVVGSAGVAPGDEERSHAFLWEDGKMQDLGTLGGLGSWAVACNERGQVTGFSEYSDDSDFTGYGRRHAFLWEDGEMRDLGSLGGPGSWPSALNEAGHVVGHSMTITHNPNQYGVAIYVTHAFLWDGEVMLDLGTLGGGWSEAVAVNEHDQVVGYADIEGYYDKFGPTGYHAFLSDDGNMIDLGTLGGPQSQACAINDFGQVVGFADTVRKDERGEYIPHAFVWQDGVMYDLGVEAGPECATDLISINNQTQIVAVNHVLTPRPR